MLQSCVMSYEIIIYVVHNSKGPTAATCQKHLKPRQKTLRVIHQRVSGKCSEVIIEAKIKFCASFQKLLDTTIVSGWFDLTCEAKC